MRQLSGVTTFSKTYPFGEVLFILEPLLDDYVHACSVEDVQEVLAKLPEADVQGIRFVIFHQPTRKKDLISPRWAAYYSEHMYRGVEGSAIMLEATKPTVPVKWPASLTPEDRRELEHLQKEGHQITLGKREVLISMDVAATRNTQLYRSLIHEIGHHVDYKRNPKHFSDKAKIQKEDFANKYALQNRVELE